DFNNLLSVIGSCAEMLRLRHPQDERSARDLGVVDDAVRQAAQLTGQLLSFARRQVLPGGHAAPGSAVQRLAPLLERALGPHIDLLLDADASRWMTPLAEGQLEQIVMNLAVNARDAMPQGGKLSVRVHDRELPAGEVSDLAPGQYVVIEVTDTGTGMTPEVCSRIFEPFYTTKGPGRGTGLGLATCFGLARQVGGTLTVESRVGEGSTFRLHVPRKVSMTMQPVAPELPRADRRGLSVLVADDEQRICELVARMLELMGHQAVTATSGADALKQAGERGFDLILSDVMMGGDDGLDLLEHLRRVRPDARLAVMSGFSPSPERLSAMRETGIGFLAKPFSYEALRELVERRGSLPERIDDEPGPEYAQT
ncbi:MAG TPA: ATP-binding protein, partial [Polyangiales bacterium]